MSTLETLRDFATLGELDRRIGVLQTGQNKADSAARASELAEQTRIKEREQVGKAIAEGELKLTGVAKELRSIEAQLFAVRQKHGRSRSEAEVNAAEGEGDDLRRLSRDVTADRERTQAHLEQLRQRQLELDEAIAAAAAQSAASPADAPTEDVAPLQAERESVSKRIPAQLLKRYEMVRAKKGTSGIAATSDGTCSGCHLSLSPAIVSKIRREPVIEVCPSCYRLVYFAPHIEAAAPAPVG